MLNFALILFYWPHKLKESRHQDKHNYCGTPCLIPEYILQKSSSSNFYILKTVVDIEIF